MRVLIISSNAKASNGDISFQMLQEFKKLGHQVKIATRFYKEKHEDIVSYLEKPKTVFGLIKSRIKIVLSGIYQRPQVNNKYYFQDIYESVQFFSTKKLLAKVQFNPDIIIVLFNQNFLNTKNIYQLNKLTNAPIILFMIDMALITGGCHYAWECLGYINECGKCPGLNSNKQKDLSRVNFKFKKENLNKTDIHLIAASEWQYRQAKNSFLYKNKPIHKILTAIDSTLFKPEIKNNVRNELGLPVNKKIIFFGSADLLEERKGLIYFFKALEILNSKYEEEEIHILFVGKGNMKIFSEIKYQYTHFEYLEIRYLSKIYQASDVFVCPSIEDSGPLMINQAIMSGLPVVSFEMGVAPDLVISNNTGYIAKNKDINDLAKGINSILELSNEDYQIISNNCRNLALQLLNWNNYIKQISTLIKPNQ